MKTRNKIKSWVLLVVVTFSILPSSVYAVDGGFDNDFGNEAYEGDYLFEFMNESDNDFDENFGSDDVDFNAASEDPIDDFSNIFGDLLGEVDNDFDDNSGSDDIDFNAGSEESEEDFSSIFGDLLSEVDNDAESEEPIDDFSDIFGDLLGDIEEDEEIIEDTSMNVEPQQYPNCKAIDDMLYGYSMVNVSKFIDIEESLYKNDIIRVENAGVIDGRSANTFDPYEPITRAEFLSVAMKAHCIDFSSEGVHDFSDVEKTGWKARVISKAISEDIISGSTNAAGQKIFRPNDAITRMEVLAILLNMTRREIPWDRESPYIDIASQQWQKNYVTRWNELGLFMPYKTHNKFYPNRYVMREHIGTILYNVVQLYR